MRKLTEEMIAKYEKPKNKSTGVEGISREFLESLDLDTLPTIIKEGKSMSGDYAVMNSNGQVFSYDRFTPRAASIYFKPSFAGRQVIVGVKDDGEIIFSNGRWFIVKE